MIVFGASVTSCPNGSIGWVCTGACACKATGSRATSPATMVARIDRRRKNIAPSLRLNGSPILLRFPRQQNQFRDISIAHPYRTIVAAVDGALAQPFQGRLVQES